MMKRNGFTLIEVIVSIFILTILFGVGTSLGKFGVNISNDMESLGYVYEIQNLLSYGKAVCREKNNEGKIDINYRKNQLRFVDGWDDIEKIVTLPKGFMIISGDANLFITNNGKIARGYTIKIVDKQGKEHDIVIRVGVDMWSVHE